MPTAPTREDVRAYIGTNGTYSDDAIDSALAAETAAQAKVVRLPADPTGITVFPVLDGNASEDSWWGSDVYVRFITVTATVTRDISTALDFTLDGVVQGSSTMTATVWSLGDQPTLTQPSPWEPSLGSWPHPLPVEIVAGRQYVIALICWGASENLGQEANFGQILAQFNGYPADLLEALFRRTQRLLEMRSKPLGYQDTATEFGVAATRVGPDPEIRRLESPYRKLVLG